VSNHDPCSDQQLQTGLTTLSWYVLAVAEFFIETLVVLLAWNRRLASTGCSSSRPP
jgi:hypothetical protein